MNCSRRALLNVGLACSGLANIGCVFPRRFVHHVGGHLGCHRALTVNNLVKSGPAITAVRATLDVVMDAIDDESAKLFGGVGVFKNHVSDLLRNDLLAVAEFESQIAAITGTGCTNIEVATAAIVVNVHGAFFNNAFNVREAVGGSLECQVRVLLHELGHSLDVLVPDAFSRALSRQNDDLIDGTCKGLIRRALRHKTVSRISDAKKPRPR